MAKILKERTVYLIVDHSSNLIFGIVSQFMSELVSLDHVVVLEQDTFILA